MNNKISAALIIILSAFVVFLLFRQHKLNEKIDEFSAQKEEVKIAPTVSETKPANPADASPFDKPNTDPMANSFVPQGKPLDTAAIAFSKQFYDFGRITEGQKVRTAFRFTNTSAKPLYILGAQSSCGCTVPSYPHHVIQSGAGDEILVEFDSEGKHGEVQKIITVNSNTIPSATTLIIKSTVVPRDK